MVVLDTDVLSLHQRRQGDRYARLAARAGARTPEQHATATRRLNEMRLDFEDRAVLLFDDRAVAEFKRLKATKIKIGTMDLRIASIVLANAAALISRNRRDFQQVPGLQVEDWTV